MSYLDKLDETQRELRRAAFRWDSDIRNWDPGKRERHRIRRALHELLDHVSYPAYTIRTDGERLFIRPKEAITPEARRHAGQYKQEIIDWIREWEPKNAQGDTE